MNAPTGAGQAAFDPRHIARYRRQLALAGFGHAGQRALDSATVVVLGAGGLGSPALLYLAGAGVGRIRVIDDDTVDLSNLHRQVIHTTGRIGEPKADSAARALAELNPDIEVEAVVERLRPAAAGRLLAGADVLVDGADNFAARHTASFACARAGIPHVWGSILGFQAQASVFSATDGPVYEDLFPQPPAPGAVPSCAQAGVLGPVVGQVGSLLAMEAIKVLTGIGEPLCGRVAYLDSLAGTWEYIPLRGDPATAARVRAGDALVEPLDAGGTGATPGFVPGAGPTAGPAAAAPETAGGPGAVATVAEIPPGAALLDVRDDAEFAAFHLPGAVHVPLAEILAGRTPEVVGSSVPVVVYCAAGVRSAQAIRALADRGVTGLVSLAGGVDGWLDRHAGD